MFRKIVHFLIQPFIWKFLLLILLFLAIWFIGPLFAFAQWRPLETVFNRIAIIALVAGYVITKKTLSLWRAKRVNERFLQALANKGSAAPASTSAVEELEKTFADAINQLKNATSNLNIGFFSGMRQRFVYQFPWYVFIGAPGSGKTTALVNSGLQFPLANLTGNESLKGVGGTRHCDWWITDSAVFIDTAGRYITHESNAQQDKDEWGGFLALLKKFRPRQPLNGAVLTISVADLLTGSEQSRERHAAIIRARLAELSKTLGINFPVYLLVTKADLLGGFSDYFNDLPKEERNQVFGFTFADDSDKNDLAAQVGRELELLGLRLFENLPELILRESDLSRRAHSFSFPQNFANCSPLVSDLVAKIFSTADTAGVQLRGIYFTSGTQEGTPFDRVLGALGRRFGVSSNINPNKKSNAGRSYFLTDLIAQVVLPEAHLAGKNRREEKKALWLGLTAHGLIFIGFLTLALLFIGSFYKNQYYLQKVDEHAQIINNSLEQLSAADARALVDYLPVLNALCCVTDGEAFPVAQPPLQMTLGLYQGEKLDAAAQRVYQRALQGTLLPLVARRLQQLLESTSDRNMDATYQALKAYLMLNQPERYSSDELLAFLESDFNRAADSEISREQQAAIVFHLRQLFGVEAQLSPYPIDESLVQSKRRLLSGFSFAERAYQTLKSDLLRHSDIPEVSFLTMGGAKSNFVFERKSGKPLSDGLSGLFTRKGYKQLFLPAVQDQLESVVTEESWVLGEYSSFNVNDLTPQRAKEIQQMLVRLYLQDYGDLWDTYLADLRLISTRSMSESIDVARILSAADSPLIQLISNLSLDLSLGEDLNQLSQLAAAESKKRLKEKISGFSPSIQGLAAAMPQSDSQELIVDARFKDIVELTHGTNKEAEKNTLLKMFNELYLNLSNADFSIRSGSRTLDNNDVIAKIRSDAARYPVPVRTILEGLTDEGKRQAEGGIRGALNAELNSSIGEFCKVAITGRYPFDRTAMRDVTFDDFSKLFASTGLMNSFFNENLRAITDTSGRYWTLRQATDVALPIASFQQAARIRDVFFPAGASSPVLNFEYKVLEMDAAISQLSMDFDGQLFQYAHGPQIPRTVTWPGPLGSKQIRIELNTSDANRQSLVVNGPWAIMRLFDMGARRQLQPEKFITALTIQGYKVVLEVTANSVNNPFYLPELASFSCPVRR